MPIDYEKLLNLRIPDSRQSYTDIEPILYALSLGVGSDPLDPHQLRFVYEKNLAVLPTFGLVLGRPGYWVRDLDTGIDWVKVVHGEQGLIIHKPLPQRGAVVSKSRVTDIIDKGSGRGALVYSTRELFDEATGDLLMSMTQTAFCRGDGGFGGPSKPQPPAHQIPDRAPDGVCDLPTLPQTALIYRLSGDRNPIHADPVVAKAAGFDRPILHGLATFGLACYAVLKSVCRYDLGQIASVSARFTQPLFPGEILRTEIWRDDSSVSFRTRSADRNVIGLDNGIIKLH